MTMFIGAVYEVEFTDEKGVGVSMDEEAQGASDSPYLLP